MSFKLKNCHWSESGKSILVDFGDYGENSLTEKVKSYFVVNIIYSQFFILDFDHEERCGAEETESLDPRISATISVKSQIHVPIGIQGQTFRKVRNQVK